MLISEKTALKKAKKLRHAEYYDMTEIFDKLYADSVNGKVFVGLMDIITSNANIMLAYRNIKRNTGSHTAGVDGKDIRYLENLGSDEFCALIKRKFQWYRPHPVKRVEIPKGNGKMRPLGIPTIIDRVVQQCILQVMEPICEAKFHERSNGFRPNRSVENAMAQCYFLSQVCHLHYVVDIDIKGFFDNVDHTKLVQQIWALGIRDKKLICVIKAMLKASIKMPDKSVVIPTRGTPQGGILSPLLANIVLNELDWWIDSQWISMPTKVQYKAPFNKSGGLNQGDKYRALKRTRLKEMYMVRYADDFKIFCRDRTAAMKTFHAVKQWIADRLHLEINEDKSAVTDLSRNYTDYIGFKFRLKNKAGKLVVQSKMCNKAKNSVENDLCKALREIGHAKDHKDAFRMISKYNSMVIGVHNFYNIATDVSLDMADIAFHVNTLIKHRFNRKISKEGLPLSKFISKAYGDSSQIRYLYGLAIIPIGYVRTKKPMHKPCAINKYTAEGRVLIHSSLRIDVSILHRLMRNVDAHRSIEYSDNRLSLYAAQHGRCAITGKRLEYEEIHCHHKVPRCLGGSDEYTNLIIVHENVHRLIHCKNPDTIASYLAVLKLSATAIKKVNRLRMKCGLEAILA